ncbi:MAG: HAMP domain-containing histidine kinase [Clostridia bacterium]|nr:HAMP domain-containing histidine kinase [Clostridia bacterium]
MINLVFLLVGIGIASCIFFIYRYQRNREITRMIKYVEEINSRNYSINMEEFKEGRLSILKSELYKTTIMLKESADNSLKDKQDLKKSLEDISHQLKTPLTSILVMLDNLIDDEEMAKETREDFLRDIKREITSVNFLVQSILKLSKFDANTIEYNKEKCKLEEIVKVALKNVSTLCDLKNIMISLSGDTGAEVFCDFRWQVEAVTNIIKNCVEHSKENGKINIRYEENKVYSLIEVQDFGEGIDSADLPHIFERFYKGKNASPDSVGIGLALSKTIVENDNGRISAESDESGTKFIIKYFK